MPNGIMGGFVNVPPSYQWPGGGDIHLGKPFVTTGTANFNTLFNGVAWVITDIEGWWSLPEITIPDDQRSFSQDGSYYQPGRYGVRNITVRGMLIPQDGTQLSSVVARRMLTEALETARETRLFSVDESTAASGTMQAEVQCTSVSLLTSKSLRGNWEFEFALRAPDPRKYAGGDESLHVVPGASQNLLGVVLGRDYTYEGSIVGRDFPDAYLAGALSLAPGVELVNNRGTYNTGAILRLWGPLQEPSIELMEEGTPGTAGYRPAKILTFRTTIAPGDYYEIDLIEHSVMLMRASYAPVSRRGTLLPTSQWFMIEPGQHYIRFQGYASDIQTSSSPYSGALEVRYRSAWIS